MTEKTTENSEQVASNENIVVRVATPDEPLPHTALLEQALSAMADVQERAEPGFAPDVAVIPAEDWRAFVDAHAEILLLWTAWRDSPYRDASPGAGELAVDPTLPSDRERMVAAMEALEDNDPQAAFVILKTALAASISKEA